VAFLMLKGSLPNPAQAALFNAILISCVDHGVDAPSVHVTRTTASCGVPVQSAIASGVNAIGEFHGGAGEACARYLQQGVRDAVDGDLFGAAKKIVEAYGAEGKRLPGFGHRLHNPDQRAEYLFLLADQSGVSGPHTALMRLIQTLLNEKSKKELPINVDGALGALLSDMGFDPSFGKSVFIISRVVGLAAHAHEQQTTGKPLSFAQPVPVEFEDQ